MRFASSFALKLFRRVLSHSAERIVIPTGVEGSDQQGIWTIIMREYFVYIMSSHRRTLYIGVTNNLAQRVHQHKSRSAPGFTSKYGVTRLVYAESCGSVEDALEREKQLKRWRREKKIKLVMTINPEWNDLAEEWNLLGS